MTTSERTTAPTDGSRHRPAEAVAANAPHWRRERCIELTSLELARRLGQHLTTAADQVASVGAIQWNRLASAIEELVPATGRTRWAAARDLYQPFDIDAELRDERIATDGSPVQPTVPESAERFFSALDELARAAAYDRLARADIVAALNDSSDWGVNLHVDFEVFRRLEVYARGDVVGRRTRRRWQNLYRLEEVDVPIYRRMIVAYWLQPDRRVPFHGDPHCVYLRLFKNVPKQDLEMLLPGTRVKMTMIDQGRILLPTFGGLALLLFKLIKGIFVVAFAGLYGMLALLGLLGGTFGYGVRTFLGYLRTRDRYQLNLASSLYYQNLGSNRLVLLELAEHAGRQETCEALLAAAALLETPQGLTAKALGQRALQLYRKLADAEIVFDPAIALAVLNRCALASQTASGHWQLRPLDQALGQLRQTVFDV